MPYESIASLPKHVKTYSEKVQRQWLHVFNTTYSNVLKETNDKTQAESRAFKAANSVLKKRFKEGQNLHKEQHSDYIKQLVDQFLGRLDG